MALGGGGITGAKIIGGLLAAGVVGAGGAAVGKEVLGNDGGSGGGPPPKTLAETYADDLAEICADWEGFDVKGGRNTFAEASGRYNQRHRRAGTLIYALPPLPGEGSSEERIQLNRDREDLARALQALQRTAREVAEGMQPVVARMPDEPFELPEGAELEQIDGLIAAHRDAVADVQIAAQRLGGTACADLLDGGLPSPKVTQPEPEPEYEPEPEPTEEPVDSEPEDDDSSGSYGTDCANGFQHNGYCFPCEDGQVPDQANFRCVSADATDPKRPSRFEPAL